MKLKRYKLMLLVTFLFSSAGFSIDGLYLGGQVGQVGLAGSLKDFNNDALGFGLDLGFKPTGIVDLVLSLQFSNHAAVPGRESLSIMAPFASAELHIFRAFDFDITLAAGPGFYSFKTDSASVTKFGLHFGAGVDFLLDDHFRIGLAPHYHAPFGTDTGGGSYWTVMMRAGYQFELL